MGIDDIVSIDHNNMNCSYFTDTMKLFYLIYNVISCQLLLNLICLQKIILNLVCFLSN